MMERLKSIMGLRLSLKGEERDRKRWTLLAKCGTHTLRNGEKKLNTQRS